MNTFIKMSWRNLYRNPRRTSLMALIVAIGFVGTLFILTFMNGYLNQSINNAINAHTGHMQIHQQGFNKNPVIKRRMQNPQEVESALAQEPAIQVYSKRIKNQGMVNSPEASSGVLIVGMNPEQEGKITKIKSALSQGEYLQEGDDKSIYMGASLAKKLKIQLHDKVVLMGQTVNQEVGAGAYRLKGLFETASPGFDKGMVFITLPAAEKLFEMQGSASEFSLVLHDRTQLSEVQAHLKAKLNTEQYEVMTWQEVLPQMAQMLESSSAAVYIIVMIILVAICFSIINTLFVVVFERFREFGIMKAVGTRPKHIFTLIILEAMGMTFLGIVLGSILSVFIMGYFSIYGLNLAAYAKGLSMLNIGDVLYLRPSFGQILSSVFLTFFIVLLAALYPAIVAARIEPIKALKFV